MKHSQFLKLRPTSVRVMGRNYDVQYSDLSILEGTPNLGVCNNVNLFIGVLEGQHPIEEADTFLHETLHAIWYMMDIGHPQDEEFVVRKLATGLIQVLMDNPHLAKYLEAARNF